MGGVLFLLVVVVVCGGLVAVLHCRPSSRDHSKKYSSRRSEEDVVFTTPSLVLVDEIVQSRSRPSGSTSVAMGEFGSDGHGSDSPSTASTELDTRGSTVPNSSRNSTFDDVEIPDDYLFSYVCKV